MKVKYLARLLYGQIDTINVVSETDKTYTKQGAQSATLKETKDEALFSTELDAKRFIAMQLNRQKNEARNVYNHAQSKLLETLLRFNLEQCGYCNEFHEIGAGHDCTQHPF